MPGHLGNPSPFRDGLIKPSCLITASLLSGGAVPRLLPRTHFVRDSCGNRTHITITPVGGLAKVPSFVSLLGGSDLSIAVLIDVAGGGNQRIAQLASRGLLARRLRGDRAATGHSRPVATEWPSIHNSRGRDPLRSSTAWLREPAPTLSCFAARCRCGARHCRGRITGWRDLPTRRKADYHGFVAPYLIEIDHRARTALAALRNGGSHRGRRTTTDMTGRASELP